MYAKILLMTALLVSGQVYAQSTTTPDDSSTSSTTTTPVVKKKKKKKKAPKAVEAAAATNTTTAATTVTAPVETKKNEEVKRSVAETAKEESTVEKVTKYLRDHFSASYHGENYFTRRDVDSENPDDHAIKDFSVLHNPTIIYKPTPNWQVLSTAEFKYTDAADHKDGTYINSFYRALFTLTRKNILTEKENGVGLEAGIGRRQFNTRTYLGRDGYPVLSKGNDRVFTTISKSYGKHSGSLFVQYLYNDPIRAKATTWKHSLEVIPTITLQLTDKLSYMFTDDIVLNTSTGATAHDISASHEMNVAYVNYQWTDKVNTYYQLKYYHTESFNAIRGKDDWFEHYAGIGYAFTPKLTVTGEIGSELFHHTVYQTFFSKKAHYPEFALYIDAAL